MRVLDVLVLGFARVDPAESRLRRPGFRAHGGVTMMVGRSTGDKIVAELENNCRAMAHPGLATNKRQIRVDMDRKKFVPSVVKALEAKKRKAPAQNSGNGQNACAEAQPSSRALKRVKVHDARHIRSQPPDAALDDGKLDLQKFLNAREFEIRALEESMRKTKSASSTRTFQEVPRAMRRRTASHNVKRIPKRLRERAKREQIEDNTPTIDARKRRPRTTRARIRAETARRLDILAARKRKLRLQKAAAESSDDAPEHATIQTRPPRPKIRRNTLNEPPKIKSKFRKRQVNKTWLPTHVWHAKRATMTKPSKPLWRFAVPLTSTEKCYRPTHRAVTQKGAVIWDMSYMSTIGLYGTCQGVERVLRALGLTQERLWGLRSQKWRAGLRKWSGILSKQQKNGRRDIGPSTIVWNPESRAATGGRSMKVQRQLLIRTHPSCFLELFNELLKLSKMQNPQLHVEDLRFEIGSIELTGPGSTEALIGTLKPYHDVPETEACHGQVLRSLAGVTNPASLPKDIVLAFSARDPRLAYPPKRVSGLPGSDIDLVETLTSWPADRVVKAFALFDRDSRFKASQLPSQKSINRRKGSGVPGKEVPVSSADAPIPVVLFASKESTSVQAQGTWTLLAPWKCILPIWYSLVHFPLSTGGNPRLGGLNEQRQIAFEQGTAWFPGDFPTTDAGLKWELEEREKRKQDWARRPKGKRTEWSSLDLGAGRKGEVGDGLACDYEHLFGLPKSEATPPLEKQPSATVDSELDKLNRDRVAHAHKPPSSSLVTVKRVDRSCFQELASPSSTSKPPKYSLATVSINLISRGVVNTCARIYQLPTQNSSIDATAETEVPATIPPPSSEAELPSDLREQWLEKLPHPGNANSASSEKGRKGRVPLAPRMPPGADLATRKRLLAATLLEAPTPDRKPASNQADFGGHPLCPNDKDLIGFVTTGAFNLGEGKGTAIGSISAEKAVEALRQKGQKEGKLCIVRNAGESVGWLAHWEVI